MRYNNKAREGSGCVGNIGVCSGASESRPCIPQRGPSDGSDTYLIVQPLEIR